MFFFYPAQLEPTQRRLSNGSFAIQTLGQKSQCTSILTLGYLKLVPHSSALKTLNVTTFLGVEPKQYRYRRIELTTISYRYRVREQRFLVRNTRKRKDSFLCRVPEMLFPLQESVPTSSLFHSSRLAILVTPEGQPNNKQYFLAFLYTKRAKHS